MITVAIIEDNARLRAEFAALVEESAGFRLLGTCDCAEDALKRLPGWKPQVALMDIQLPGLSGIECTARLREILPETHVLILTVYEDVDRIFQALQAGATGYLLKRAHPEDILNAIREVEAGGAPMTSQIARKVVHSFHKAPVAAGKDRLSPREEEILEYLTKGYSSKEIADRLSVSINTIRTHLSHIYEKLHVQSRAEAIIKRLRP